MRPEKIVEWMADRGIFSYAERIAKLQYRIDLYAEEEKHGEDRVFEIKQLKDQQDEIRQEALDRYDDWASDPLD